MRYELQPWGIEVANINPAYLKTPMVTDSLRGIRNVFNSAPRDIQLQYPMADDKFNGRLPPPVPPYGEDPKLVINMVKKLLYCRKPSLVNHVGILSNLMR